MEDKERLKKGIGANETLMQCNAITLSLLKEVFTLLKKFQTYTELIFEGVLIIFLRIKFMEKKSENFVEKKLKVTNYLFGNIRLSLWTNPCWASILACEFGFGSPIRRRTVSIPFLV